MPGKQNNNVSFFSSALRQRRLTENVPSKGYVTGDKKDVNDSHGAQEMGWKSPSESGHQTRQPTRASLTRLCDSERR